jgi:purine-binding chemotaxis protein CheW
MKGPAIGLLGFTLGGERYGLPLQEVAEVMEPPRLFPVPRAPVCIKGTMNFHGNLVAVLDLACLFGQGGGEEGKVLVLDQRIASLALLVDNVDGFFAEDVVSGEEPSFNEFVGGVIQGESGAIRLLILDKVLEKVEELLK